MRRTSGSSIFPSARAAPEEENRWTGCFPGGRAGPVSGIRFGPQVVFGVSPCERAFTPPSRHTASAASLQLVGVEGRLPPRGKEKCQRVRNDHGRGEPDPPPRGPKGRK